MNFLISPQPIAINQKELSADLVNNHYWYARRDDHGNVQFVALSYWSPWRWYYWMRDYLFDTTICLINDYYIQNIQLYRHETPQEHERGDNSIYFKKYESVIAYQNLIKIVQFGRRILKQQVEKTNKAFKCSDSPRLYSRQMGNDTLPNIPKNTVCPKTIPKKGRKEPGAYEMIYWMRSMGKDISIEKFENEICTFNQDRAEDQKYRLHHADGCGNTALCDAIYQSDCVQNPSSDDIARSQAYRQFTFDLIDLGWKQGLHLGIMPAPCGYDCCFWHALYQEDYELAEAMWLTGADLDITDEKGEGLIDKAIRNYNELQLPDNLATIPHRLHYDSHPAILKRLSWLLTHGASIPERCQNDPLILKTTPTDLEAQIRENHKKREQKQEILTKEKQRQLKTKIALTAQCLARLIPHRDITTEKSTVSSDILLLISNMSQI